MPFCTECGTRHDESARTCPKCGAAIAVPPDDDLDNLIASMDTVGDDDEIAPGAPESSVTPQAYLEEIQGVRGTIATQSTALQGLIDLSWSNPEANAIREQLAAALERLHALTPPPALAGAHEDFVDGAELLARGFGELVDATEHP